VGELSRAALEESTPNFDESESVQTLDRSRESGCGAMKTPVVQFAPKERIERIQRWLAASSNLHKTTVAELEWLCGYAAELMTHEVDWTRHDANSGIRTELTDQLMERQAEEESKDEYRRRMNQEYVDEMYREEARAIAKGEPK
jgi:hypothetical protein